MALATPIQRSEHDPVEPAPCPLCGSVSCADEVEAYLYRTARGRDPQPRPEEARHE